MEDKKNQETAKPAAAQPAPSEQSAASSQPANPAKEVPVKPEAQSQPASSGVPKDVPTAKDASAKTPSQNQPTPSAAPAEAPTAKDASAKTPSQNQPTPSAAPTEAPTAKDASAKTPSQNQPTPSAAPAEAPTAKDLPVKPDMQSQPAPSTAASKDVPAKEPPQSSSAPKDTPTKEPPQSSSIPKDEPAKAPPQSSATESKDVTTDDLSDESDSSNSARETTANIDSSNDDHAKSNSTTSTQVKGKCPICGHQNRIGVLVCENCGTQLTTGVLSSLGTRDLRDDEVIAIDHADLRNTPISSAEVRKINTNKTIFDDNMHLRIEIEGVPTPIIVHPKPNQETALGRRDPNSGSTPEVDLTPYAGYRMGVSRRHAILQRKEQRLDISDLGSSNGTFVNGMRLGAHWPCQLQDGDEIRLGQMVMHVYFRIDESK